MKRKLLMKWAKVFIFLGVVVYGVLQGIIIYFGNHTLPRKSDVILILGCRVYGTVPSAFLEERTKEGLRLFQEGYGKYILVSGGKGPGEDITEAAAMQKYLMDHGVPSDKILLEDKSTSTMENLQFSKVIMKDKGLKNAVIVSNKFHLKRVSLMAKDVGIESSYAGVFVSYHKALEIKGHLREVLALVKYYVIKS